MRILPNSQNANLLFESKKKIDQAYNYIIKDAKVEKCYKLICDFFNNINIRYFEHFFSSIDIAICALREEKLDCIFSEEINYYYKLLNELNDKLFQILFKMFKNFKYTDEDICELLDFYSKAEMMYILFSRKLSDKANHIYMMLPHGKEDLNI